LNEVKFVNAYKLLTALPTLLKLP